MLPKELIAQIRRIEIRTSRLVNHLFGGEYHSIFKGQGIEFEEVREYQPGDDVRLIDWNVTARAGTPFVKKFREEREMLVMLLVDLSASGRFGTRSKSKNQVAAETAAILAFAAIKNNDKVGMIVFTDQIELYVPPRKGRSHVLRLIREILYFSPRGRGTDISGALQFFNRVTRRRSVAFLISDFFGAGYEHALSIAHQRHDVIAVKVEDARERKWVDVGLIEFEDLETGRRVVVDSTGIAGIQFDRAVALANLRRKRFFDSIGLDQVNVATDAPIADNLVKFFRNRERRARR
ncbi:MAG: DUF58 domain-containing protein [candidate division Zixibacteria bacterium]|nr:DUF58 domain-containing protein [candidate division Zixibacteria bacterium]